MADEPAPGTGETYDPQTPQTNTSVQEPLTEKDINDTVTLSREQFDALLERLSQGNVVDRSPSPAMGLQTNALGQVVGTVTKYSIDPELYPSPIDALLDDFDEDSKTRRLNVRENYYISWDMDAKPYQTKDGVSVVEPTFHVTIHENRYDEEGNDTGQFIVRKTLHFNEDEELINIFVSENGLELSTENSKELRDRVRYQRVRNWMINEYFFPPRVFAQHDDTQELAVDGTVVKVITKSNVKGWDTAPVISDEELS